jgi:hypothetical protein
MDQLSRSAYPKLYKVSKWGTKPGSGAIYDSPEIRKRDAGLLKSQIMQPGLGVLMVSAFVNAIR